MNAEPLPLFPIDPDLHVSETPDGPKRTEAGRWGNATVLVGDVRDRLADIPDHGVDFLCTSPPFLALRSYLPPGHPDKHREIGSEPDPATFIDTLLALTADWGRVLAPWGSIAVELGDTFAGSGGAGGDYNPDGPRDGAPKFNGSASKGGDWPNSKSLCGIPQAYALSLMYGRNVLNGNPSPAGQWRVRNIIVWARPNPPVGSLGKRNVEKRTGDQRFRVATSYITVATRGVGRYFDLDGVREPVKHPDQKLPPKTADRGMKYVGDRIPLGAYDASQSAGAPPLDWHADHHPADGDWLWKLPTAPYRGSHYACVDDATEALTPHGWKRHDRLRDGDLIATWDRWAQTWHFAPATFHRYPYDGELVAIDKRVTNQRLTPNHRVAYATKKDPAPRVREADTLVPSNLVPLASPMDNAGSGPGVNRAALVGWVCTEASITRSGWPKIHQSATANPANVETIRALLDAENADYSVSERKTGEVSFTVRGQLGAWLAQFHKNLPPDVVFRWRDSEARALFDAMVDGDGHRRPDGRISFIQKSKAVAESFQMLALRLGYRTTLTPRAKTMWTVYVSPARWVDLRSGDNGADSAIGRERYVGTVWCPSVSTGMWVARRNGQPFITGNTYPLTLPKRLIEAMCPRSVCTVCGWPRERVVDVPGRLGIDSHEAAKNPERGCEIGRVPSAPRINQVRNTVRWTDCGCKCPTCDGEGVHSKGDPYQCPACNGSGNAYRNGVTLDPFLGSGTTAAAALALGRDAIGIELDERNLDLIRQRVREECEFGTVEIR